MSPEWPITWPNSSQHVSFQFEWPITWPNSSQHVSFQFLNTILPPFQGPHLPPFWSSPDTDNLGLKMAGNLAVEYFFSG